MTNKSFKGRFGNPGLTCRINAMDSFSAFYCVDRINPGSKIRKLNLEPIATIHHFFGEGMGP